MFDSSARTIENAFMAFAVGAIVLLPALTLLYLSVRLMRLPHREQAAARRDRSPRAIARGLPRRGLPPRSTIVDRRRHPC
jgi:hypothetical protein